MRKTLLLFTGSYPYAVSAENTFLPQEIAVLRKYFETVIIIPTKTGGGCESLSLPNVVVDTTYAEFTSSRWRTALYALRGFGDVRLLAEVVTNLSTLVAHPRSIIQVLFVYATAEMTERWIRKLERRVCWQESLLYTWWFDATTLGLSTFGRDAQVPVLTRAHGRDLYESRQDPAYIPFRRVSLDRVGLVFSASDAGARYLAERYPTFQDKIRTALLGIDDPGFLNIPSSDGVFRILSCSFMVPVKRIALMIRGVAVTGRAFPARLFEWTHIGIGPEKESLASLARSILPNNVKHQLLDYAGKSELYDYYRTQRVDVFINTSKSEGTPVSIMEAISVGIPVIATAVGGNTEIVGPDNGMVIAANPEPREIADAIGALACDAPRLARLRAASREKWRARYSAEPNYSAFAKMIKEL